MAIAQQLYEGVDIAGEGTVGLITYMRTDSLRISEEAHGRGARLHRWALRSLITAPSTPRQSIRPRPARRTRTRPSAPAMSTLTPEQVKGDLTGEQYRLYRLIWSRFLASQMANAVYDSVSVELAAGEHTFRASASSLQVRGLYRRL